MITDAQPPLSSPDRIAPRGQPAPRSTVAETSSFASRVDRAAADMRMMARGACESSIRAAAPRVLEATCSVAVDRADSDCGSAKDGSTVQDVDGTDEAAGVEDQGKANAVLPEPTPHAAWLASATLQPGAHAWRDDVALPEPSSCPAAVRMTAADLRRESGSRLAAGAMFDDEALMARGADASDHPVDALFETHLPPVASTMYRSARLALEPLTATAIDAATSLVSTAQCSTAGSNVEAATAGPLGAQVGHALVQALPPSARSATVEQPGVNTGLPPWPEPQARTAKSIRLQLHPADLGAVEVRMTAVGDQVRISLRFDLSDAATQVAASRRDLEQTVAAAGLQVTSLTIEVARGTGSAQGTADGPATASGDGGTNAKGQHGGEHEHHRGRRDRPAEEPRRAGDSSLFI